MRAIPLSAWHDMLQRRAAGTSASPRARLITPEESRRQRVSRGHEELESEVHLRDSFGRKDSGHWRNGLKV
jgi:hypothetical protein